MAQRVSQLFNEMKPYLAQWLRETGRGASSGGGGGGGSMVPHLLGGEMHTGTLEDAQAPQFLKSDGSRALSGSLAVAVGATVDGVDISEHAINPDAHHARRHGITSADDHTAVGSQYSVIGLSAPNVLGVLASTADGAANHNSILRSGAAGDLTLDRLISHEYVRTPKVTTNAGQDLDLEPGDDVRLAPASNVVRLMGNRSIQSDAFVSGWAGGGFRLDYNVTAPGANLQIDNLWVRGRMTVYELIIHQIRATNGSLVVTSSARVKAVSGGPTIWTIDTEEAHGFSPNDLTRSQRWTGNGIYQSNLTVSTTPTLTRFTAALQSGSDAPAVGMDFVRLGNTTDVTRQGLLYLTADDAGAPYMDVVSGVNSWAAWADPTKVKVRVGKITGITGQANEFGAMMGNGFGDNFSYLRLSNQVMRSNNIPMQFWYNGTQTGNWSADGRSIWVGPNSGDKRLHWDGVAEVLTVKGAIVVQPGSGGYGNLTDRPTTLYQIDPAEGAALYASRRAFADYFTSSTDLGLWIKVAGGGNYGIASTASVAAGGRVLVCGNNDGDDMVWLVHGQNIPFDASKVYKITARLRRLNGTGTFYLGFSGVAADGATYVNAVGDGSHSNQHYTTSNISPSTTNYVTYTGYVQGYSAAGAASAGNGSIDSPRTMHQDVRFVRPTLLVNYSAQPGTYWVDYITVEILDPGYTVVGDGRVKIADAPTVAGAYVTPEYIGHWTGSEFKTYLGSNGDFVFKGSGTNNYIAWVSSANQLRGVGGGVTRWYADASNGRLYAAGDKLTLDDEGIAVEIAQGYSSLFERQYKLVETSGGVKYSALEISGGKVAALSRYNYGIIAKAPINTAYQTHLTIAANNSAYGRLNLAAESGTMQALLTLTATNSAVSASLSAPLSISAASSTAAGLALADDTDSFARLGRTHVGYVGVADSAGMAHRDQAGGAGTAGWRQVAAGDVIHNVPTGRVMYFRVNNSTVMQMTAGRFDSEVPFGLATQGVTPDAWADGAVLWFDGTSVKVRTPNGTVRTLSWT